MPLQMTDGDKMRTLSRKVSTQHFLGSPDQQYVWLALCELNRYPKLLCPYKPTYPGAKFKIPSPQRVPWCDPKINNARLLGQEVITHLDQDHS